MSTTPLQPLQFELGDVIFGADTPFPVSNVQGLGAAPLRSSEYSNPFADGRSFGREFRDGRELSFEGGVKAPGDDAAAWDGSGDLEAVFDAEDIRSQSRTVMPLRFRRPGKPTRVVYGRPDKYDPEVDQAVFGWIPWSATFRCSDRSYYADQESGVVLSVVSQDRGHIILSSTGGLTSPIRTTVPGVRATSVTNAGDTDAWTVVTINGPIVDPYVALLGPDGEIWRLQVEGEVAHDQVVTIDTRPWSRGASQNGGPLAGRLSTASTPSRAVIPAGTYDIQVGGIDPTGTATFDIRWRDAYRKI